MGRAVFGSGIDLLFRLSKSARARAHFQKLALRTMPQEWPSLQGFERSVGVDDKSRCAKRRSLGKIPQGRRAGLDRKHSSFERDRPVCSLRRL